MTWTAEGNVKDAAYVILKMGITSASIIRSLTEARDSVNARKENMTVTVNGKTGANQRYLAG